MGRDEELGRDGHHGEMGRDGELGRDGHHGEMGRDKQFYLACM
jgi:hypothetical protein